MSGEACCAPPLVRYMDSIFISKFFSSGSLKLTSFDEIKKHEDGRADKREGTATTAIPQRGGGMIFARSHHGTRSYVLCTSLSEGDHLRTKFHCNSYFRISNAHEFAKAIANNLEGIDTYFHGPCAYQAREIYSRVDFIPPDFSELINAGSDDERARFIENHQEMLATALHKAEGVAPLFIKPVEYKREMEYRFVFRMKEESQPFVVQDFPEAIEHCEKVDTGIFVNLAKIRIAI